MSNKFNAERSSQAGVDIATEDDACPDSGRASYPAVSRDERLAFMASANSGRSGQDLIDLPWALVVYSRDGVPNQVLDGIRYPRGLAWMGDDRLIFSGTIGDIPGIWSIGADGIGLARVADEEASWLSVSPDSRSLVAIRKLLNGDMSVNDVVLYEFPAS